MQTINEPSERPTILSAENNAGTLGYLNAAAGADRYKLQAAPDGAAALLLLAHICPSLIVLDVGMTTISWFGFYTLIRGDARLGQTPILILADSADQVGKLADYGMQKTDFAVKPSTPQELTLRIKRLLGAGKLTSAEAGQLRCGDLQLDMVRHEVTVRGSHVYLTAMEFKLLTVLAQRRGRPQTRERLLQDAFDYDTAFLETRTIDTHVRRLRIKLGPVGWRLETVRGVGYRFCDRPGATVGNRVAGSTVPKGFSVSWGQGERNANIVTGARWPRRQARR
jgi:two-component system phosphate regulon response regulator PhoB